MNESAQGTHAHPESKGLLFVALIAAVPVLYLPVMSITLILNLVLS